MGTRKHIVADKRQAFVTESIANYLTAVVLDERTKLVRVDDLHFDALGLNNPTMQPTAVNPLAYFITANVKCLGQ